ncbi:MAG: methyltransferase [Solirubrobacteraceae bacterium]
MSSTDPTSLYRLRDGVYAPDLLIVAIADLDLFTRLVADGGLDARQLREAFELDARAADVMVTYLVALGLLERADDERILVAPLAADHLVAGSRFDLRAYFGSLKERPACRELLAVLRTGEPAAWASAPAAADWESRLGDLEFAKRITSAMDARGAFLGPALAAVLDDLFARRVLDIGGSSGAYSCALVDRFPGLSATVFERPPVDRAAQTLLADRGYGDRVHVVSGDMFSDPLPAGHDLHLFSHVLHDWGEEQVRQLLTASFAALEPGGWLVEHDTHVNANKTGPLPVAEYSVLLMHSTPGKCWSEGELAAFLQETGFVDIDRRPTAADRTAIVARRA